LALRRVSDPCIDMGPCGTITFANGRSEGDGKRLLSPCFGLFSAPVSLSLRHIFWFARMVRWMPSTFQIHGSGHQYERTQLQVRKPRGRAPQRPIRVGWRHARVAPGVTLTVKNFYQSHLINLISGAHGGMAPLRDGPRRPIRVRRCEKRRTYGQAYEYPSASPRAAAPRLALTSGGLWRTQSGRQVRARCGGSEQVSQQPRVRLDWRAGW
jgi:hypothetical protein